MNIEAIQFIPPDQITEKTVIHQSAHQPVTPFVDWIDREASQLNAQILGSERKLRELAAGQSGNLHQVMMELEKSKISFQLVLEVRNRLLEAYQDVMRTQV